MANDLESLRQIARMSEIPTLPPATTLGCFARISAIVHEKTNGGVWWRGHASAKWQLISHIFRSPHALREKNLALRFITKAATRHSKCPDLNDTTGWLFLMQHYGLPTRLMDWSESILVAAYFAVSELQEEDGTIWALLPYHLNIDQLEDPSIPLPEYPQIVPFFQAVTGKATLETAKAVAVFPFETDMRMLMQSGTYTVHSSGKPLEEFPCASKCLLRVPVPAASKDSLTKELWNVGIRRSTLFPDLHNLATELKMSDPSRNF